MPSLRSRLVIFACLVGVCLHMSHEGRAAQVGDPCAKPTVTYQADGKSPSVDPLPEVAFFWGDHMDWPVLDRAAYERLTVAASRLPALVVGARHFLTDALSRTASPAKVDDGDRYEPTAEERVLWQVDFHEFAEFLGAVDMAEENLFAVHEMLRVDHSRPCVASACALAVNNARLARQRLEESARRMAALSRDTDEECLKARDSLLALTPALLAVIDTAIRPIEARACRKWADSAFPVSPFGKNIAEAVARLAALTDALEHLNAPGDAEKGWWLVRREAVILARTARTSMERTGRFVQVGSASCTLFVNIVEDRLASVMNERLRVTLRQLREGSMSTARLTAQEHDELRTLLLELERCCSNSSELLEPVVNSGY